MAPERLTASELIARVTRAVDPQGIWPSVRSLNLPVRAYGPFFFMVGQGDIFDQGGEVEVFTRETRVVFTHFPRPGLRGIYTGDAVRIEDADGTVLEERREPRKSFRPRFPLPRWDRLDVLYFFGYALWNYVNFPFDLSLPGVEARLLKPARIGGKRYDRMRVTYPEGFHTHSRTQEYLFDEEGLLFRHDYVVEIIGPWLRGRHYTLDWARADEGFAWATRRRVRGTLAGIPWQLARAGLPLLLGDLGWLSSRGRYAIFGDIDRVRLNRD
jgi:hypothetical protein